MNIGFIAHDTKKSLIKNFCVAYRGILAKNTLYATGTTGEAIEHAIHLPVHKFLPGHLGGKEQFAAEIENNNLDLVIFLRNPLNPKKHEPNISDIARLCDQNMIPMATNIATAEILILALDRGDFEFRNAYK